MKEKHLYRVGCEVEKNKGETKMYFSQEKDMAKFLVLFVEKMPKVVIRGLEYIGPIFDIDKEEKGQ